MWVPSVFSEVVMSEESMVSIVLRACILTHSPRVVYHADQGLLFVCHNTVDLP